MEEGNNQWNTNLQQNADYSDTTPELAPVEWSASEYVSHQKSSTWFIILGGVSAVITFIVFIVTRNILSGLVVAMACVAIGVYAGKQPETKRYEISEEGITAGEKFFAYATFKSFSIVDDGAISCIWLRPLKKLMPTVVMYYAPDDEDRIVMMLDNFLPQEDREHDAIDRLSRRIRF